MIYTITNFSVWIKIWRKKKTKQVKTYKVNKAVKIRNKSYEWRWVNESMYTSPRICTSHCSAALSVYAHWLVLKLIIVNTMKTKCKSHTQQTRNIPVFDWSGVPMSGGGWTFNRGDRGVEGRGVHLQHQIDVVLHSMEFTGATICFDTS